MKSKAQISSQVFVYIMAAVIVVIILAVGYKAVSTILKAGNQIPLDNLKDDFDRIVSKISRQYESVEKYEFRLPDRFDTICFVDSMTDEEVFDLDADIDNLFIEDSIKDNVPKNVFLLKNNIIEDSFYVDNLNVESDYLCLENEGLLTVTLIGKGNSALLR